MTTILNIVKYQIPSLEQKLRCNNDAWTSKQHYYNNLYHYNDEPDEYSLCSHLLYRKKQEVEFQFTFWRNALFTLRG